MRNTTPKPVSLAKLRCPTCFHYGAEPTLVQRWSPKRKAYIDVKVWVRPDCPTCHGLGYIEPAVSDE